MAIAKSEKAHMKSDELVRHKRKLKGIIKKAANVFGGSEKRFEGHHKKHTERKHTSTHHGAMVGHVGNLIEVAEKLEKMAKELLEYAEELERDAKGAHAAHKEAHVSLKKIEIAHPGIQG